MNISREPPSEKSLLFAGDYAGSTLEEPLTVGSDIRQMIEGAHASFVNLEAPVHTATPSSKFGPILDQQPDHLERLHELGVDVVTLANNHAMDHGRVGLEATIRECERHDLSVIGAGSDRDGAIEPIIIDVGGTSVAVINGCQREFGIATSDRAGVAWIRHPRFLELVRDLDSRHDVVVVVAHGGIEYVPLPPPSWQRHLRHIVRAGADMIIGHHPHVAQAWEQYEGAPIFYSLGNCGFRDPNRSESARSYMVHMDVTSDGSVDPGVTVLDCQDSAVLKSFSDGIWNDLLELCSFIERSPHSPGFWQAVATEIYPRRYEGRLADFSNGHLLSSLKTPQYAADRLLTGHWGSEAVRSQQELALLNYFHNSTHRDVITTALGLATGVSVDERNGETDEFAREWLPRYDSRISWSRWDRLAWYARMVGSRLGWGDR